VAEWQPVVAVVDRSEKDVAVWWVSVEVGQPSQTGRLCGAWLLAPDDLATLATVVAKRLIVATSSGHAALLAADAADGPYLDVAATWSAATLFMALLQEAFETEQGRRSAAKQLIAPRWPVFPVPFNLDDPPTADEAPPPARRALGIARAIDALCAAWEAMETERLARPVLRQGFGSEARQLPVVLSARLSVVVR
jgi:hypothetical protein